MNFENQTPHKHDHLLDNSIRIIKAQNRREYNTFIRVPWSLYRDDPMWVPPLVLERRMHLSPKNPYFEHATCCFWIAYRDEKPVGRISAQIDRLHLERYQDDTGFWGMLEAEDNIETFQTLLNTAENWLRSHGMVRARGPFSLSIN
ncbi:MAG: N-acetyltransferase, partial [Nitrospirota bacterium]